MLAFVRPYGVYFYSFFVPLSRRHDLQSCMRSLQMQETLWKTYYYEWNEWYEKFCQRQKQLFWKSWL